jgi:predicted transcriptional regulator
MPNPNYTKEQMPMLKRHIKAIENILQLHFAGEIKLEQENITQLHEQLEELTEWQIVLYFQNKTK